VQANITLDVQGGTVGAEAVLPFPLISANGTSFYKKREHGMNSTKENLRNLKFISFTFFLFSALALPSIWFGRPWMLDFMIFLFTGLFALFAYRAVSSVHKRVLELEGRSASKESAQEK
jgi:hypothetical protein